MLTWMTICSFWFETHLNMVDRKYNLLFRYVIIKLSDAWRPGQFSVSVLIQRLVTCRSFQRHATIVNQAPAVACDCRCNNTVPAPSQVQDKGGPRQGRGRPSRAEGRRKAQAPKCRVIFCSYTTWLFNLTFEQIPVLFKICWLLLSSLNFVLLLVVLVNFVLE